jgi:formylglycine-generating enzyme required for sulfatase activity/tRNA A-37 threonylcarbamoyl transferase component Bud32
MVTTAALLDELRKLRLLPAEQLEEWSRLPQKQNLEPRDLGRQLIERGWLTAYQANQLLQGRGPDLLLGPYLLLERLGEGGMGTVFKARHRTLGRLAALKVIRKERLENPDAVKRFHREVRAAAQLNHPNVVLAFDAAEAGSRTFLVMEYVEGIDLAKLVKAKGPLPVATACEYVRQAALGLQHAHERGLVHRDIKPANLLLAKASPGASGSAPLVKVLDMGLARLQESAGGDSSDTLTKTGAVMGTPDFLAPEQARRSHEVDIRADLYSLGCTLYFLLTGQVPFPGGTLTEKLLKHQLEEPVPVEQLRPEVPAGIAAVVRKLMAKRPEVRYQTPKEVADVLAQSGERTPVALHVETVVDGAAPDWGGVVSGDNTVAYVPTPATGPRSRRRWLVVGTGLLLGLGIAVLLLVLAVRLSNIMTTATATEKAVPTVDRDLAALEARFQTGDGKPEQMREAVLNYCRKYLGTPQAARAARLLRQLPPLENSIGMKLVPIPPGEFLMGSPVSDPGRKNIESRHEVLITRPFYLGMYEVTVGQFQAFVQATHYQTEAETGGQGAYHALPEGWKFDPKLNWQNPGFEQTAEHPVVCVSWHDAVAFCDWLSNKEDKKYGLPTEAQWEYACRAGTQTRFSFGDDDRELTRYAWHKSNAGEKTHRVGEKQANAWGLYDMHGNVWEWCQDWYGPYEGLEFKDPLRTHQGAENARVCRGGSWNGAGALCRAAWRSGISPGHRVNFLGLRVCIRLD